MRADQMLEIWRRIENMQLEESLTRIENATDGLLWQYLKVSEDREQFYRHQDLLTVLRNAQGDIK